MRLCKNSTRPSHCFSNEARRGLLQVGLHHWHRFLTERKVLLCLLGRAARTEQAETTCYCEYPEINSTPLFTAVILQMQMMWARRRYYNWGIKTMLEINSVGSECMSSTPVTRVSLCRPAYWEEANQPGSLCVGTGRKAMCRDSVHWDGGNVGKMEDKWGNSAKSRLNQSSKDRTLKFCSIFRPWTCICPLRSRPVTVGPQHRTMPLTWWHHDFNRIIPRACDITAPPPSPPSPSPCSSQPPLTIWGLLQDIQAPGTMPPQLSPGTAPTTGTALFPQRAGRRRTLDVERKKDALCAAQFRYIADELKKKKIWDFKIV